jgi:sulfide:quinone oxidoreductase
VGRSKPRVLVLGGSFAGLECAQKLRELAGDAVEITVVDRRPAMLFVPNIPVEVLADRNPATSMYLPLPEVLDADGIAFLPACVEAIDVERQTVTVTPAERPGAASEVLPYDYLVVAVGARLAYDRIEGFAQHGHTVSDTFYGNKLRHFLHRGGYRGGPVAVGSARFHQGQTGDLVPQALAACEGPVVEMALALGSWLQQHRLGGPSQVTVFTPAALIAEDAGTAVVQRLLRLAGDMGYHYLNEVQDVRRLGPDGMEFADGRSLEAELMVVFPDWVPHPFLQGLPICDDRGFVLTDRLMRNPRYPAVFAAGDAAAISVPKLGSIAHDEADVVARQIARDLGVLSAEEADRPVQLSVFCIGDMGSGQAFYIHSDSWYGGAQQELRTGRIPALLKLQYKELFFRYRGKVPAWGPAFAQWVAEHAAHRP